MRSGTKAKYRRAWCRDCEKTDSLRYYHEHRSKMRAQHRDYELRLRYGISHDDYLDMEQRQNGVCAICKQPPTQGRYLHVDHDHSTGRVRGLLCPECNAGLGRFGDDIDLLLAAIAYLKIGLDLRTSAEFGLPH